MKDAERHAVYFATIGLAVGCLLCIITLIVCNRLNRPDLMNLSMIFLVIGIGQFPIMYLLSKEYPEIDSEVEHGQD